MTDRLTLGIAGFSTYGGSGIVATEIGLDLARRGHRVHFFARSLPVRLHLDLPNVRFHPVAEIEAPAFEGASTYPIALASTLVEVAQREHLDLIHVHYAVPHATAAWLARDVLGPKAPRLVTTLHGTDVTRIGPHPSYLAITRASILRCDAVTTPSAWLAEAARRGLRLPDGQAIDVVPNFVDTERFCPPLVPDRQPLRQVWPDLRDGEPVVCHVSNFRPVKRISDVVAVFAQVHAEVPARLLLVGDGPDRAAAQAQVEAAGLQARVAFLGKREHFETVLAAADVFLLPSETESFGLAALEALSCGVPVVATAVGGVPEVVQDGRTGLLAPLGDRTALAAQVLAIVRDPGLRQKLSQAARADVVARFRPGPAIDQYEGIYRRVLAK